MTLSRNALKFSLCIVNQVDGHLGKVEAAGSNPVTETNFIRSIFMEWILFVALYTNSLFYGKDWIPTMRFETLEQCMKAEKFIKQQNDKTVTACHKL